MFSRAPYQLCISAAAMISNAATTSKLTLFKHGRNDPWFCTSSQAFSIQLPDNNIESAEAVCLATVPSKHVRS